MVEGGMPPMEAIRAATINAADLLGMSDVIGTIEKGKMADIIAVSGDPLQNIEVMSQVKFVMKEGKVYKSE
jgi:imidazolonepropionase-like amidohydrolase